MQWSPDLLHPYEWHDNPKAQAGIQQFNQDLEALKETHLLKNETYKSIILAFYRRLSMNTDNVAAHHALLRRFNHHPIYAVWCMPERPDRPA
jgi:hypothetical protein